MRWIEIGQIIKPHGLAGRVKVLSYLESDRLLTTLKEDRIMEWLTRGAEPTLTVSQLLRKKGITIAKDKTKVA